MVVTTEGGRGVEVWVGAGKLLSTHTAVYLLFVGF